MKTINEFKAAQRKIEKIQKLDAEILELEKLAIQLANDECSIEIDLTISNLSKVTQKAQNILDEDGSINSEFKGGGDVNGITSVFHSFITTPRGLINPSIFEDSKQSPKHETTKLSINEYEALYLIQPLLNVKLQRRAILINELSRLGVKL